MKSTVGIYDAHEDALEAIKELKRSGYSEKQLSIIGKAELVEDHLNVKSMNPLKMAGLSVGMVAGSLVGVLTGLGFFAVPGFGFLYGAGALVGGIGGLDIGVLGGGIVSVLTMLGIKEDEKVKYEQHLRNGLFIVVAQGTPAEVKGAKEILMKHGKHLEVAHH